MSAELVAPVVERSYRDVLLMCTRCCWVVRLSVRTHTQRSCSKVCAWSRRWRFWTAYQIVSKSKLNIVYQSSNSNRTKWMGSYGKIKALSANPLRNMPVLWAWGIVCIVTEVTHHCAIIERAPRVRLLSHALPVSAHALTAETVEAKEPKRRQLFVLKNVPLLPISSLSALACYLVKNIFCVFCRRKMSSLARVSPITPYLLNKTLLVKSVS